MHKLEVMCLLVGAAVADSMSNQSQTFDLEYNPKNNLFTIDVAVGQPEQKTKMLIDLQNSMTHAFSNVCSTYLTRPHKFYTKSGSKSSNYLDINSLHSTEASGFVL